MEEWLSGQALITLASGVWSWIQENVLVWATAMQAAAAAAALGLALLAVRKVHPWLEKQTSHSVVGTPIRVFLPALMPSIWLILLWISLTAATELGLESHLLSSVAGLLFAWVVIRLASQLVRNPVWSNVIVWAVWTIAALNILGLLQGTIDILEGAAIDTGSLRISLWTVVQSTLALVVLLWLAVQATSLLESRIRTSRALSPSLQVLFVKSFKMVLIAFAIIVSINALGIDLTALAVFGGAVGLGVGFGLQRVVANLISGVILLVDKSIKPGDVIAIAGTYGWVTTLGGRYVSVVTRDGVEHLIPNELLMSERVENWTHSHSRTRLKVKLGIHYSSDVHKAIALCLEAAGELERILKEPEPKCLLLAFGDSSIDLQVRFWIADAHNGVQNISSELLLKIWDEFKEHGIEIPYPQRDLHLRSGFEALRGGGAGPGSSA